MDIKTYIYQLRVDTGISQRELSRRAQVSHTEISRIEKGERLRPSPTVLKKLAPVLGVKSEQLMEAAGYIKMNANDFVQPAEGEYGDKQFNYQWETQQYNLPILCKEGGTVSGYLNLQPCKDIDFALRIADNRLACASIYKGDLALCNQDTDRDNARVLVVENIAGMKRELTLSLNTSVGLSIASADGSDKVVTDGEWCVIGSVVAVLRSMEWESAYNEDMIQWQDLGINAKKMGFTPDQVRWMLQTQRQFLRKYYNK